MERAVAQDRMLNMHGCAEGRSRGEERGGGAAGAYRDLQEHA